MESKLGTIGGTTAAAICGLSPWKSPRGAYLSLIGEAEQTPDNEAMARGRLYEDVVARVFQANHSDWKVLSGDNGGDHFRVDKEKEYFTGRPDRFIVADGRGDNWVLGLEIKTASSKVGWGRAGSDDVPLHYLVQCQWYMGITTADEWYLAVMFFNGETPSEYREYLIKRRQETIDYLRETCDKFWNENVLKRIEPEDDRVDETVQRYVSTKFAVPTEGEATATEEENDVVRAYIEAKETAKRAEELFESKKLALKEAIGNRESLKTDYGRVTWRAQAGRSTTDWKALCKEYNILDDEIAKFTKVGEPTRYFNDRGLKL